MPQTRRGARAAEVVWRTPRRGGWPPEIGNLAFTTVKSSTYRKNVGGNAPSPHALADDTPAPLAYVRLSSITDVLRRYVRTVKTGTYIHASTTLHLKFSLRLAPLASVRKSRSSRRTSAAPGPILALIYAENPAGAAAVALGPNVSLAVHQRRVLVRDLLGHTFGVAVVQSSSDHIPRANSSNFSRVWADSSILVSTS